MLSYLTTSIIIDVGDENVLKKISALKARQNLGQIINEVAFRGNDYIIEQAGPW